MWPNRTPAATESKPISFTLVVFFVRTAGHRPLRASGFACFSRPGACSRFDHVGSRMHKLLLRCPRPLGEPTFQFPYFPFGLLPLSRRSVHLRGRLHQGCPRHAHLAAKFFTARHRLRPCVPSTKLVPRVKPTLPGVPPRLYEPPHPRKSSWEALYSTQSSSMSSVHHAPARIPAVLDFPRFHRPAPRVPGELLSVLGLSMDFPCLSVTPPALTAIFPSQVPIFGHAPLQPAHLVATPGRASSSWPCRFFRMS
jgi:hypothetical protein